MRRNAATSECLHQQIFPKGSYAHHVSFCYLTAHHANISNVMLFSSPQGSRQNASLQLSHALPSHAHQLGRFCRNFSLLMEWAATLNWFTPPAHRIAALGATLLQRLW